MKPFGTTIKKLLIRTVFYCRLTTFVTMKKNYALRGLLLGLMLLLAIGIQSFDSFHHLEKSLTEKKCYHKTAHNKAEITHGHAAKEHCFVCEFTFSQVTQAKVFSFSFQQINWLDRYAFFCSHDFTPYFKGSLFALRAPPVFMA